MARSGDMNLSPQIQQEAGIGKSGFRLSGKKKNRPSLKNNQNKKGWRHGFSSRVPI
jgi:hypothetical protein